MQSTVSRSNQLLVSLFAEACAACDVHTLCHRILSPLLELEGSAEGCLYVGDARFANDAFASIGVPAEAGDALKETAQTWSRHLAEDGVTNCGDLSAEDPKLGNARFHAHAIEAEGRIVGVLGSRDSLAGALWEDDDQRTQVLGILGHVIDRLALEFGTSRQLNHLSTYFRVSSMLGKSGDLGELLEIALYSSMEAVSAEAASVLLLDEAKEAFRFFSVEGSAEPLLSGASFPATEGFAGHVLQTMEAEVVDDALSDSRFYEQMDRTSGFRTRNLIAVPLIAGEEKIGVLEVLNRKDGGQFTADDRLLLVSIADEMAFTIRNATAFDYVASGYCRRRQGEPSCDNCKRPIDTWMPCVRYRM